MKRIVGLDSIRFICAVTVLIGHFGIPWPKSMSMFGTGTLSYIGRTTVLMFNGPAAVIIFFIISGFCINYPFRQSNNINLFSFYSRRLLRIGIPAIIAVICFIIFKAELKPPLFSVFWSIICEIIYYLLYPLLLLLRRIINWGTLFSISFIGAFIFFFTHLSAFDSGYYDYGAFGYMTWLIGLPCWISGCWLSENFSKFKTPTFTQIWILRIFMIGVCMTLMLIRFHVHSPFASYTFTLTLFGLIGCIWLGFEIMYFQTHQPAKFLESAGKWSYSLYIVHPMAFSIYDYFGLFNVIHNNSILIISSFILAYTFYLLVEKPSHKFSVYVSKLFTKKTESEVLGVTPSANSL